MKSIDFKSLLIGILGTALVMVLMGQSSFENHSSYDVECVVPHPGENVVICKRFTLNASGWDKHNATAFMTISNMDVFEEF